MLMNCTKCINLNIDYINKASGLDPHRFNWLDNEDEIGDIKGSWNSLVGSSQDNHDVLFIHWTLGGPMVQRSKKYFK